jgi:putative ABC transport system permease protein
MRNSGFEIGDTIELDFPDGSNHSMMLVGLVTDLSESGPTSQTRANIYMTTSTLSSISIEPYFNRMLITIDGDGGNIEEIDAIAARVEDKFERNNALVFRNQTDLSTEHPMAATTLAILGVLTVLAVLITLLSSSLIFNTLNALLTQQLRQIGVIKLVGGQSRQILGMYVVLIIAYSMVTLVITIPLGAIAGFGFASFMSNLLGATLQGFRIVPLAFVLQVVVAIVVPLGAGYFPINQGTKTDVRTALSNDSQENESNEIDLLNRLTTRFRWISRPVLLSIRNTFRKRGRLLLTLFTLTVAGAVFIGVFNVRSSMNGLMDNIMKLFLGDVTISFNQPVSISRVEQILLPVPGVIDIEGWGGTGGEILDKHENVIVNLGIIAAPSDSELLDPKIVAGRWLEPGEPYALVVSDSIYDWFPDIEPGDSIVLKIPGEREANWEIVGIFQFISMLGDPIAYADFNFVSNLTGTPNLATSFRLITSNHNIEFQDSLSVYVFELLSDKGFVVTSVEGGESIRESQTQGINILVIILLVMALLTAFVGSIGLTGTMGMNVIERTREIGIMRAIGAVDYAIMQSVVIEALVIALITWVLAIVLSYPISFFLLSIIGAAILGSSPILVVTPTGILIWLAVVIGLSIVASILPARNAAKLTINEGLSYE